MGLKMENLSINEIRTFPSGATRSNDLTRIDWVKMISVPVLLRYGEYMARNRVQADGSLRDFDNWKKGFPLDETIESMMRHMVDLMALHTDSNPIRECNIEDSCCAILFNAMAYLHEYLMEKGE